MRIGADTTMTIDAITDAASHAFAFFLVANALIGNLELCEAIIKRAEDSWHDLAQ